MVSFKILATAAVGLLSTLAAAAPNLPRGADALRPILFNRDTEAAANTDIFELVKKNLEAGDVELFQRQLNLFDFIGQVVNGLLNTTNTLASATSTLQNGDVNNGTLTTFVTTVGSLVDDSVSTIATALSPFTFGLSTAIANIFVHPLFQAVASGADAFIVAVETSPITAEIASLAGTLQSAIQTAVLQAQQSGLSSDVQNLLSVGRRLSSLLTTGSTSSSK